MSIMSGVIFIAITITAVFLIYTTGVPLIKKMQTAAAIEKMKGVFAELDEAIRQTASEGRGSKRTMYMKIDQGKITANSTQDVIYWEIDTDVEVISPRTYQHFGNMVIGANLETRGYEGNYTFSSPETPCYIVENEYLRVYVKKIGSSQSHTSYNTTDLLVAIYNKDMDKWLNNTGFLDISVDFNSTTKTGQGYTELVTQGYNLPYGTVSAFLNSTTIDYYINFTLESGADFLEIEGSL